MNSSVEINARLTGTANSSLQLLQTTRWLPEGFNLSLQMSSSVKKLKLYRYQIFINISHTKHQFSRKIYFYKYQNFN